MGRSQGVPRNDGDGHERDSSDDLFDDTRTFGNMLATARSGRDEEAETDVEE